jgi:hypothetical protein
MSDNFIPAKATSFRGTVYRSRLEARWAVFFSKLPGVAADYEPMSYEYADGVFYTPDFLVSKEIGKRCENFLLEIKPLPPARDYLLMLNAVRESEKGSKSLQADLIRNLYLGCGSFYRDKQPELFSVSSNANYTLEEMFLDSFKVGRMDYVDAVTAAAQWRFDL